MGTKDPRVDAYIENANPFARPILKRLRKWSHQYCPEWEETLNSLEGMGSFGKIRSLGDLPAESAFAKMAREAMRLTDEGVKAPPKPKKKRVPLTVPADVKAALAKNPKAQAAFMAEGKSRHWKYLK